MKRLLDLVERRPKKMVLAKFIVHALLLAVVAECSSKFSFYLFLFFYFSAGSVRNITENPPALPGNLQGTKKKRYKRLRTMTFNDLVIRIRIFLIFLIFCMNVCFLVFTFEYFFLIIWVMRPWEWYFLHSRVSEIIKDCPNHDGPSLGLDFWKTV